MTRIGAAARARKAAQRTATNVAQPFRAANAGLKPCATGVKALVPTRAKQHLHRQLIEALVAEPAPAALTQFRDERLNFAVRVPLPGAVAEDQIRAHAAAREVADAVVIFRPVGVRVEVPRA